MRGSLGLGIGLTGGGRQSLHPSITIAILGDSVTAGFDSTDWDNNSYVGKYKRSLQAYSGNGGEGYIAGIYTDYFGGVDPGPGNRWTFTGSWVVPNDGTVTGQGAVNGRVYTAVAGAAGNTAELDFYGNRIQVMTGINQAIGGALEVYIDDVLQDTIDIFGDGVTANFTYGNVFTYDCPLGNHTIKLASVVEAGQYAWFEGVRPLIVNGGSVVDRFGKSGMRAEWMGNVNESNPSTDLFYALKSCVDIYPTDHFVIAFGLGDFIFQTALATFETALEVIVDRAKAKGDVTVLAMAQPNYAYTIPYSDYVDIMESVALAKGVNFLNVRERWGNIYKPEWMGDNTHPNDLGHADIAQYLFENIK